MATNQPTTERDDDLVEMAREAYQKSKAHDDAPSVPRTELVFADGERRNGTGVPLTYAGHGHEEAAAQVGLAIVVLEQLRDGLCQGFYSQGDLADCVREVNEILAVAARQLPKPGEPHVIDTTCTEWAVRYRSSLPGGYSYQLCDTEAAACRFRVDSRKWLPQPSDVVQRTVTRSAWSEAALDARPKSADHVAGPMFVRVEPDDFDDGCWIAECDRIPGAMSDGDTPTQALRNLADAIEEVAAVLADEAAAAEGAADTPTTLVRNRS